MAAAPLKGSVDAFVAKYTPDGQHIWWRAAGSAAEDRGLGIAVDASGAVCFSAESTTPSTSAAGR